MPTTWINGINGIKSLRRPIGDVIIFYAPDDSRIYYIHIKPSDELLTKGHIEAGEPVGEQWVENEAHAEKHEQHHHVFYEVGISSELKTSHESHLGLEEGSVISSPEPKQVLLDMVDFFNKVFLELTAYEKSK